MTVRTIFLGLVAVMIGLGVSIGPDRILFDYLIPLLPGEVVQSLGVYTAQVICQVNKVRQLWPEVTGIKDCERQGTKRGDLMRVAFAVNKGGSVLGARASYDVAWTCGYCPGFGHNKQTLWPPQPDFLPTYTSDIYLAIPNSLHWEKYAFQNPSSIVKCIYLTRDPSKRLKSLLQYAWEGGEPALWEASKKMKALNGTFYDVVDWAWTDFAEKSMQVTHSTLLTAKNRPECVQIKFEDFVKDFDGNMERWLNAWDISPEVKPVLIELLSRHDLNRLTPEQKAAHHHVSGNSLNKAQVSQLEDALKRHPGISSLMAKQQKELGY